MDIEPEKTNSNEAPDQASYIRTFAKDYARLSGKSPEPIKTSKGANKPIFFKSQSQPVVIRKTKLDESLITTPDEITKPVELSQLEQQAERVDAAIHTADTFHIEEITHKNTQPISLPRIDPSNIVQTKPVVAPINTTITEQPTTGDVEREAILARLKARVASHAAMPTGEIPIITPIPVTQIPTTAEFSPIPSPVAAPAPMLTSVSIPTPYQALPQEETPEAIHTYKSDFADHIQQNNASAFSVLAAEKDAHVSRPAKQKSTLGPRIALVLGASVLILAGAGAVYEVYLFMNKSAPIPLMTAAATPIIPDSSVALSGTGQALLQALAQEASQPIPVNNIVNTYVTEATTTSQGQVEEPETGGAFLSELNLSAPDILLRNIDPSSMVGVVNAGGETRPFFILKVTSYQRTFSGMLTWESTMFNDLSLLYPKYPEPAAQPLASSIATTTATSTEEQAMATSSLIFIPPTQVDQTQPSSQFTDEIVANHDTRVLTDLAGRTLLIYGYVDKQTLIIARNEAAFTLLLNRLEANPSNE